jgi:hypothetical protein
MIQLSRKFAQICIVKKLKTANHKETFFQSQIYNPSTNLLSLRILTVVTTKATGTWRGLWPSLFSFLVTHSGFGFLQCTIACFLATWCTLAVTLLHMNERPMSSIQCYTQHSSLHTYTEDKYQGLRMCIIPSSAHNLRHTQREDIVLSHSPCTPDALRTLNLSIYAHIHNECVCAHVYTNRVYLLEHGASWLYGQEVGFGCFSS